MGGMRSGASTPRNSDSGGAWPWASPERTDPANFQGLEGLQRGGFPQSESDARCGDGAMMDFSGKVVLISGGSRGIGRACATAFANLHATVVIGYLGNETAAQETLDLVKKGGGKGTSLRFDVADTQACADAVEKVVQDYGRLDVLVNNAGLAVDGLVMRTKDEDWDRQLDTNLKGAFALIRAAARTMMKQRAGALINISSVVGETGNTG